jgi:hypothetical protein
MDTFTIQQIADCLLCPEQTVRKLLNDAGAELNENKIDPGELVTRDQVLDLVAVLRAGGRAGRELAELLRK